MDALLHHVNHHVNDMDDNLVQVVLRPEQIHILAVQRGHASVIADKALLRKIRACPTCDMEVIEAL